MVYEMKRIFVVFAVYIFAVSCASETAPVTPPDQASLRAVEITSQSNSARISKLEKQLDEANREIDGLRVQNRQLSDSYDGMVDLFKEHRGLTMSLIQRMNTLLGPGEGEEQKK